MKELMKATVKIVVHNWNGWSKEKTKTHEFMLELKKGDSIDVSKLNGYVEVVPIKILEVGVDILKIKTSGLVVENSNGGINLMVNVKEIETLIKKGQVVRFVTQTTDMGTTYAITYL